MTAATEPLPRGREPILPPPHTRLRRQAVFDKQQAAARFEDAAHLTQRARRVRNAAERPGRDHGIDARVIERDRFAGSFDQYYRTCRRLCRLLRHSDEARRPLQAREFARLWTIERDVNARSNADFEHAALRGRDHALPIGQELAIAHREVDEMGYDPILIEAHAAPPCIWPVLTNARGTDQFVES